MENKSIIKRIKDYFVKQKSIRQLAFSTLKGVQKGILHVLLWVEGEKNLGPCYGSAGIHSAEE